MCVLLGLRDRIASGWRVASCVDSVVETDVKKMRAEADGTEPTQAIKGRMKTNGHVIGWGDGKQIRLWWGGWGPGQ